ncbi:hypothetical protein BDR22DRAFT_945213 [Usnea florida]
MAGIVLSGIANDTDLHGILFQGIKFWISHKVPQRSRFLNDVKANGGEIVPLEKNADVKIVDHARKEAPPGSHSYTFIEKSVRNGVLEDLDDHKVGPPKGNIRSIGSVVQPAKGTRNRYTEADDRILWDWVHEHPQKGGGTDGNEIYKQLEQKHPQHPWQSWRDRWIRHLKDRAVPFTLPHNAPPTPPSDVPPTIDSSRNRATTSDTGEDEYQSFSDDDAEALMINGDDILNIHPDNITEAWESWTRDQDKDSSHTAQQWRSFWEEKVRPIYLRRMAKQRRKVSADETMPARTQNPISPMKTVAATPSKFSPFKTAPSPDLSHQMRPELENRFSPNRSTAALPSALSPISKPYFPISRDPLENKPTMRARNVASPKRSGVTPPSYFSPSAERHHSLEPAARSPSYHPESPTLTAASPKISQQGADTSSIQDPRLPSLIGPQAQRASERIGSPHHETLKRKHVGIEEELPSSSPLGPLTPKRKRPSASELPIEIASTPEKRREPDTEGAFSPLFIKLELEEDEASISEGLVQNSSPLGQQLSNTLSEPGRVVTNTQAIFGDATQLIDFDISAPDGGWDDEELLVQDFNHPVSLDAPPPEDSSENNKHSIRESLQQIDFDVLPPEGGWDELIGLDSVAQEGSMDENEPQIKEESPSPNGETHDHQPTLPDTQAILRGKIPAPDFSVPDPDGGWNTLIASSPPLIPSSPRRAESPFSQTDLQEQMDAWIDAHAVHGISVQQVESALKSTCMDTALAHSALRHLKKRGTWPTDRKGVWTPEDDEDLRSTDARKIQRLQGKHGAECLTARWEFLDFFAGEEGGGE